MAANIRRWKPERVRQKIRASMLARRLQKFALGEKEQGAEVKLSMAEIKAIEILLRKTVPDLTAVEHSGEMTYRNAPELTDAELSHIAASSSPGAVKTPGGAADDPSVH